MKVIQTMPCRVSAYEAIVEGFKKTNTHLISYDDKCSGGSNILSLGGHTDYVGSYFFIPNISRLFNLDINLATNLFYTSYGLFCILISLITFNYNNISNKLKIIGSLTIIFLGSFFIAISDTYSFYGLTSLAIIPFWDNYLIKQKKIKTFYLIFFSLFSGFILGISNSVRGFSGTFVAIPIIMTMIIFDFKKEYKIKFISIILIIIPIILVNNFFNNLLQKRDLYFIENPDLNKKLIERGKYLKNTRAVWHNAFYNLAFLKDKNISMPEKSDSGSIKWARKINPKIKLFTEEYEKLLRDEYFKFIILNPSYFIKIVLAKFLILILYFIFFCNYGLYILYKETNHKKIFFYTVGLIMFGSIGMATEPLYSYMLGFFAFSSLFTLSLIHKE